jgi:hypothetical protein
MEEAIREVEITFPFFALSFFHSGRMNLHCVRAEGTLLALTYYV